MLYGIKENGRETLQSAEANETGPLTFEKVWAALMETKKRQEETDRQMKETDRRVGEVTNRFGDVVEHMIVPNLVGKFNELGFVFNRCCDNMLIQSRKDNLFLEVDAFLENGDCVMAVELKTTLRIRDIGEHIERMKKLRRYADLHNDTRKYYGAIAGVIMGESEKTYALKRGFYVVQPSGETFAITPPEGPPKAW
jgi:hypothetical protein